MKVVAEFRRVALDSARYPWLLLHPPIRRHHPILQLSRGDHKPVVRADEASAYVAQHPPKLWVPDVLEHVAAEVYHEKVSHGR